MTSLPSNLVYKICTGTPYALADHRNRHSEFPNSNPGFGTTYSKPLVPGRMYMCVCTSEHTSCLEFKKAFTELRPDPWMRFGKVASFWDVYDVTDSREETEAEELMHDARRVQLAATKLESRKITARCKEQVEISRSGGVEECIICHDLASYRLSCCRKHACLCCLQDLRAYNHTRCPNCRGPSENIEFIKIV